MSETFTPPRLLNTAVLAAIHGLDYEIPVKVVLFKDRSWPLGPYLGFFPSSARQFAVKHCGKYDGIPAFEGKKWAEQWG